MVSKSSARNRIEFIDLAKGLCIIMVLFAHLESYAGISLPTDEYVKLFRMPLYFFLSGLFFKEYEGFSGFVKRKINKLLIPFLSFFLLTSIGIPFLVSLVHHNSVNWSLLWVWFRDEEMYNPPIWFLWSLFSINCIFYLVKTIISRFCGKYTSYVVLVLAITMGVIGYRLGHQGINIHGFFDTTLTAFPFFVAGNLVYRKTDFLYPNEYDKYNWVFVVILFALLIFLKDGSVDYRSNTMDASFVSVYVCGFAGLLAVLLLSKIIGRIPVISYYGRYSIMILLTHMVLLAYVYDFLSRFVESQLPLFLVSFMVVCISYLGIIPLMIKYLGYITAQKDVVKI